MNIKSLGQLEWAQAAILIVAYSVAPHALAQPAPTPARPASAAAPAVLTAPTSFKILTGITAPAPADAGVRVLLAPDTETVLLAQAVGRITALNGSLGSRVAKGQLVVGMDYGGLIDKNLLKSPF